MRVFIDTNLWVYRLDRREPVQSEQMRLWLTTVICDRDSPPGFATVRR